MPTSECQHIIDTAIGIVLTICTQFHRASFPWTYRDGGEPKG